MPAWLPIAIGASSALQSLSSEREGQRDRDLSREGLEFQRQRYNDQSPFRTMGLARSMQPLPQRPDLGADFADPSNPFARPRGPVGFGEGYGQHMDFGQAQEIETGNLRDRLGADVGHRQQLAQHAERLKALGF